MLALRLTKAPRNTKAELKGGKTGGGLGWTLEAWPVDAWMASRIEPALEMSVEEMKDGGMAASSREPILPGRRVSLSFPVSPFLPRPGTVAVVDVCERVQEGYRLELSFERVSAA